MLKGEKKITTVNLGKDNPVFLQILGICSTLAVTNYLKTTMFMCLGIIFVLSLSNLTISFFRKLIPSKIKRVISILLIASYVTIVDILLKTYMPDILKQLAPYVGIIIANCIIMGRVETFALNNKPIISFIDGLRCGIVYSFVLLIIAFIRELMGNATLWGYPVLGDWWVKWGIMTMASGAFFLLAIFVWIVKNKFTKEDNGVE